MYAIATITKDSITGDVEEYDQTHKQFEVGHYSEFDSAETVHRFRLVDDDGITYYIGTLKGDEDGVAKLENDLFDWGAYFAGTAALFVDGELVIG